MKTNEYLTLGIIENKLAERNNFEYFSFAQETCVIYAAFATQRLFMASLKGILLHLQKWLPKIGKQTNVSKPALKPRIYQKK